MAASAAGAGVPQRTTPSRRRRAQRRHRQPQRGPAVARPATTLGSAGSAGSRTSGRAILHVGDRQDRERAFGRAERTRRRAAREELGGRQVAAEVIEDVSDVETDDRARRRRRDRARRRRTSSCRRTLVSVRRPTSSSGERLATNALPSKTLPRLDPKMHERGVRDGDDIAPERVAIRAFEKQAARVVGDEVVFGDEILAVLEEQTDGREPAVVDETGCAGRRAASST